MRLIQRPFLTTAFVAGLMFALGCSESGVQGTDLYSNFKGLTGVQALSPTAVQLNWDLDSKYSSYRVYQNNSVNYIAEESFASKRVTGLQPATLYTYNVTGMDASRSEVSVGSVRTVTTMSNFTGLTSGGVTIRSATEVNLTWDMNSATTEYKIFAKKKVGETWNLAQPKGRVTGNNTYLAMGLTAGEIYCFFVQAQYLDGTKQPDLSSQAAIDAVAPCQQMTSQMANLPSVAVGSAVPGEFPWFWTANGDPAYKTEVFDLATDVKVASRVGNGTFRAFVKRPEGTSNYYAMVSNLSEVSKVPVLVDGLATKTTSKVRVMNETGSRGPVVPPLMNGGNGQQNFGQSIVRGDFNCDGLTDLAAAMPSATVVPSALHYKETGAVIVYYSYRPAGPCFDDDGNPVLCPVGLKTDVEASTSAVFPNPVLITYPATSDVMRIGLKMTSGNFNGDCYERDPANTRGGTCNDLFRTESNINRLSSIKTCDDLVISSLGSLYVIYGDPLQGLVSGSGASTAGEDEFTCDASSNSCRLVRFTPPSGVESNSFPVAMTSGDYNNDGFDELIVTGRTGSIPSRYDVHAYRGSAQGLYPKGTTGQHSKINPEDAATATGISTFGAVTGNDGFGLALGTAYDSRKCLNGTPGGAVYRVNQPSDRKGYDLKKCDDLVIGSPNRASNRGSIFSCKGVQGDAVDKQKITSWTCGEHYPNELTGTNAGYGASIKGVQNLNGYPIYNIKSNPSNAALEVPETAGAVFVGAPNSTVVYGGTNYNGAGRVYGYYITPLSTDYFSGGLLGVLGTNSLGHPVEAQNSVPCDKLNANKTTGSLRHCLNQSIYMWPPESGVKFGTELGWVPISESQSATETSAKMLAVAAPYRTVSSGGGNTATGGGAIFLYHADVSTFGFEGATPILSPQRSAGTETNAACLTNCTWYSGGVSPFGPSVIYPGNLRTNAHFGLGGIVGGSFNNDDQGDLVASAPDLDSPTPRRGGVFIFASQDGFGPTENVAQTVLAPSVGLEGNYDFQEAKVIGDLNGDGYDDIVSHINANGVWNVVIYYGSPSGLIKTPSPSLMAGGLKPMLINSIDDKGFGKMIYAAGDTNGDGYKDVLVIGDMASYLYYGSSSGLVVTPEPAVSPVGKGPLKFASVTNSGNVIDFSGSVANTGWVGSVVSYNPGVLGVTSADFNSDGFDDMAVRLGETTVPGSVSLGSLSFLPMQKGRVVIVYGSVNGPQVNKLSGRISVKDGSNNALDVLVEDPCTATVPAVCHVQLLGYPHSLVGDNFGTSVVAVRRKPIPTSPQYDRLLISEPDANTNMGAVYVFEGSPRGVKAEVIQTLTPRTGTPGQRFGAQIVDAGDLNGDQYGDILVSTGMTSNPLVYVFYSRTLGGQIGYFGASSIATTDYWNAPAIVNNAEHVSDTMPRPQVLKPTNLVSTDLFGWGMTAIGDFNNDGFGDVAINVPNGDSTISGNIPATGYVIIYFGAGNGLKSAGVVVSPYPRCYRGLTPLCEPYQVYLPGAGVSENTAMSMNSAGDINGDGFVDLVVGGVGRDLSVPGQRTATSAGIFFILY